MSGSSEAPGSDEETHVGPGRAGRKRPYILLFAASAVVLGLAAFGIWGGVKRVVTPNDLSPLRRAFSQLTLPRDFEPMYQDEYQHAFIDDSSSSVRHVFKVTGDRTTALQRLAKAFEASGFTTGLFAPRECLDGAYLGGVDISAFYYAEDPTPSFVADGMALSTPSALPDSDCPTAKWPHLFVELNAEPR